MHPEEIDRLSTVLSYNLLDTPPEADLDELAELISLVCGTPIAIISLIDDKRQWYKAKVGVDNSEVPIEDSFCQYTMLDSSILEIPDARVDERVKNKPAAKGNSGLRFYAGIPLQAPNGHNIGTVCVASPLTDKLSDTQQKAFRLLARQAMNLLESKKMNKNLGLELRQIVETERKKTESKLYEKEAEINALIQAISLSGGLVEFSPDGTILLVNQIFADSVGYSVSELIGKHHSMFLMDEDLEQNSDFWEKLRQGNYKSGQFRRKHRDGHSIWILGTYNPILDEKGRVTKVIKIAQEITQSIESRDTLQKEKDQAELLNVQKDNFIANVSHEIRTPIHAILGFTQLLLDSETDSQKFGYLKAVKTAGDNLLFIINDILDISKIESGVFQIDQVEFDLQKTIEDLYAFLSIRALQKGLDFTFKLDEKVPKLLLGDKNRLSQVLINLVGNAIKFTESGFVRVLVRVKKQTKDKVRLRFSVQDSGIGVPAEKISLIFNRFSQSEESNSRKFGGTGLGLNISKSIVEKMNGLIQVNSKLGQGSEFAFEISLPKCRQKELSILEEKPIDATRIVDRPIRILLCEDNELNQILMKTLLVEPRYTLFIAKSGNEGVDFLKKNSVDLILMDIQMPIMDGYQATSIIRGELGIKVPIVALSANFMVKEKKKCLELGMNDYLSKPFNQRELFQKIEEWTQELSEISPLSSVNLQEEASREVPVNLDVLRDFSGGNEEFEQEMIHMFLDQIIAWLDEMKDSIQSENFNEIKASSHKLKSSFSVIGAQSEGLARLQHLAEEQDINQIKAVFDEMERYLARVIPFLEEKVNKI